ncbi:alanine:cation symporter family protein [Kocuria rhizophila]|nr:alanine:cation symporter family protein [Kocuria rhizophila]
MVFVGCSVPLAIVWSFADLMNGLMAIPSLIGLVILSGLVARETKHYLRNDAAARLQAADRRLHGRPPGRDQRLRAAGDRELVPRALTSSASAWRCAEASEERGDPHGDPPAPVPCRSLRWRGALVHGARPHQPWQAPRRSMPGHDVQECPCTLVTMARGRLHRGVAAPLPLRTLPRCGGATSS